MKTIISAILLVGAVTIDQELIAQNNQSIDEWLKVLGYGIGNQTKQNFLTDEEVSARKKQCLPQEFASANLSLSNNMQYDNVVVKYDYKQHVVLINHDGTVYIAAPNMIDEIQFTNNQSAGKLVNVTSFGRTHGRSGYYEVLLEKEQNKLVCYRVIDTVLPNYNATMDTGTKETLYVEKKEFLIFNGQKGYLLNNFKPKTLAQFDQHENALKAYIKKEKLKFKEVADLKRFAAYLWSL